MAMDIPLLRHVDAFSVKKASSLILIESYHAVNMVQKRPFDAEQIFEVSLKHPKQVEPSDQLISFPKSVFPEDAFQSLKTSEVGCRQVDTESNEKPDSDIFQLPCDAGDLKPSIPGSISVSSRATCSTIEDVRSESPVYLPIVPEYFSPDRPMRTLSRYEDIYSIRLEHLPRKMVPIGANHQADVPALDLSATIVGDEVQKRLMGTCIISMPNMELSIYGNEEIGKGQNECRCEDRGSVRCVRQHIVEAREELIESLGQESLTKLGLSDMGEQVAEKWSAEDEQLFHDFVFNHPLSLNKNFWNNISILFPSRTKKEMVSYYFDVFMLRRRAEQNRKNNLLNIDSDNDEWQGSDDDNEVATQGEDEDSVDSIALPCCHRNDLEDYDEYAAAVETSDVNGILDFTNREIDDSSKYGFVKSCDIGIASLEMKMENGYHHWPNDQNGVSNGCSQGYDAFEPCDARVWDSSFVSCSKNNIDLLPTCNMIKEVFGDGPRQETTRRT